MNIFRRKILIKISPLLSARYTILFTHRLQPPHDDCAVLVQWFSSMYTVHLYKVALFVIHRFSTVNAAPLIFADQYLQLGSVLSSHYIYGLGEHRSGFLHSTNWTKLVLWTRDQPPMVSRSFFALNYNPYLA